MKEITIDVKDCIQKILLKWRQICLWMIAGAVLLTLVGALRSLPASGEGVQEDTQDSQERERTEAAQALSDREIQDVDTAVTLYTSYNAEIEDTAAYIQNSIKMQLDPSSVPTLVLQYYINTHYQVVYPVMDERDVTEDIVDTYENRLRAKSVSDRISEELNGRPDPGYVMELIGIKLDADDIMTITICGPDQDYCETIGGILKEAVREVTPEVQDLYGSFDLTDVTETFSLQVNTDILLAQQAQTTALSTLKTALNNIVTSLTDDQKTYYYLLLDSLAEESEEEGAAEPEEPVRTSVQWFHGRYLILGLLAGAFLAVLWYGLRYILSSRLRIAEDMEEVYGTHLMGKILTPEEKKRESHFMDRRIRALFGGRGKDFPEEERMRMICAGIQIAARKADQKRIYLTGSAYDERIAQLEERLCEELKGKVDSVSCGKSVLCDPESLEKMAASDGVVLVECVGLSEYGEIRRECELCARNHVPVIGSVVLE